MYLHNKYSRWYNSIVLSAQSRVTSGYIERHHIIPKSLGGTNSKDNIVKLTAREHFICHCLLSKMVTGKEKSKMCLALLKMCVISGTHQRYKVSSKRYEVIRRNAKDANSGSNSPMYGRKRPPEEQLRLNASLALSRANCPPYKHTEESKKKISLATIGRHNPSAEVRAQWSKVRKGRPGQDNNSGKHWFNDGLKSYLTKDCPEGCVPGRLTIN